MDTTAPTASLHPVGELGIYTVSELRDAWRHALNMHDEVEIDLGGITEIDTAGLQLMLMAKRCPGKTVRFVNHADAVLRLLDLANLGGTLGDPLLVTDGATHFRTTPSFQE